MSALGRHIGNRRSSGWWEPTFNPEIDGHLTPKDWNFADSNGRKQAFLSAEGLGGQLTEGVVCKFNNITFEDCDIQGSFSHKPSVLFDKCRFHRCDFAFSEWNRATFRNCEFKGCSLALATFKECEFRDCSWEKTGLQGSKTGFIRTFVTNPRDLVNSGFSGTRRDAQNPKEHKQYQSFRLEATKAHVARTLLYSHEEVGDDKTYYETAKLHDVQQIRSKIAVAYYNLIFGDCYKQRTSGLSIIPQFFEMLILKALGKINKWGSSLLSVRLESHA